MKEVNETIIVHDILLPCLTIVSQENQKHGIISIASPTETHKQITNSLENNIPNEHIIGFFHFNDIIDIILNASSQEPIGETEIVLIEEEKDITLYRSRGHIFTSLAGILPANIKLQKHYIGGTIELETGKVKILGSIKEQTLKQKLFSKKQ